VSAAARQDAAARHGRPGLSEAAFQSFCALFYRETGIFFAPARRYYVERRLAAHLLAAGEGDFACYMARLRGAEGWREIARLVALFTAPAGKFYEHQAQLDCLVEHLLPAAAGGWPRAAPLRIWCLPAGNGAAVYSVAIHLAEQWPEFALQDVALVASDPAPEALAAAARGAFPEDALAALPPALRAHYFAGDAENGFVLDEAVRKAVRFAVCDPAALDAPQDAVFGAPFDVIFCHDLLRRYGETQRQAAALMLYERLAPGGFLCLAAGETMGRACGLFEIRVLDGVLAYQKPGAGR